MAQLAAQPDWHGAAQELVNQFAELPDPDDRISLLESFCDRLGGSLYPAFLQILYVIERHAEQPCKKEFIATVCHGLSTGRLPSGKLPAFGSNPSSASAYGQTRLLGPLEFLVAWYSQSTNLPSLSEQQFTKLSTHLIQLFSTNEEAAELYKLKLQNDISNPVAGALSSRTREGIAVLVDSWQKRLPEAEIAQACLKACEAPKQQLHELGNLGAFGQLR